MALDVDRVLSPAAGIRNPEQRVDTLRAIWTPLLRAFGSECAVESIDSRGLARYVEQRQVAGQTVRREVQALLRGLKLARAQGLSSHTIDDTPRIANAEKSSLSSGRRLDWSTVDAFCLEIGEDLADQVVFAVLTGLRLTELQRVHRHHIVRTAHGPVLALESSTTKGKKAREVPLLPRALEIAERRAVGGGPLFDQQSHKKAFRGASARLGLPYAIKLRDLRKTFAHSVWEKSGDVRLVQLLLGHSSISTTERYLDGASSPKLAGAVAGALGGVAGLLGSGTDKGQRSEKWWADRDLNPGPLACKTPAVNHFAALPSTASRSLASSFAELQPGTHGLAERVKGTRRGAYEAPRVLLDVDVFSLAAMLVT